MQVGRAFFSLCSHRSTNRERQGHGVESQTRPAGATTVGCASVSLGRLRREVVALTRREHEQHRPYDSDGRNQHSSGIGPPTRRYRIESAKRPRWAAEMMDVKVMHTRRPCCGQGKE